MRYAVLILTAIVLFAGMVWAAPNEPTLFFYEARGLNLLAAVPAEQGEPLFLIFPDSGTFSDRFAGEVGETLFPNAEERTDDIQSFQKEFQSKFSETAKVTGTFTIDTVLQIRQAADRLQIENRLAKVNLVNLNAAMTGQDGLVALKFFLQITNGGEAVELSDEQIDRCRENMERNLNIFVERNQPKVIRGALRGVFVLSECSQDRADADQDGLFDVDEINLYGSKPDVADTDGDGLTDGQEVSLQRDGIMVDVNKVDTDGDGLSDGQEVAMRQQGILVDPSLEDTDGDGLTDKQELEASYKGRAFDPTNPMSFPGGVTDAEMYRRHILGEDEGCGAGSTLLFFAFLLVGGTLGYVIWKKKAEQKVKPAPKMPPIKMDTLLQQQQSQSAPIPEPPASMHEEEPADLQIPIEEDEEFTEPSHQEAIEYAGYENDAVPHSLASDLDLHELLVRLDTTNEILIALERRVDDVEVGLHKEKEKPAGDAPGEETARALAAMQVRLNSLGRLLEQSSRIAAQPNAPVKDDLSPLLHRIEALEIQQEEKAINQISFAGASDLEKLNVKLSDVEQMVIRSMSEWGRHLTALEDRIKRLEKGGN